MTWPLVSRRAFDVVVAQRDGLQTRYDILVGQMIEMRQQGFARARPAIVHEPKDEEGQALHVAEQRLVQRRDDALFIKRAAADIQQRTGVSSAQAHAEAIRLRRSVTDHEDSPI